MVTSSQTVSKSPSSSSSRLQVTVKQEPISDDDEEELFKRTAKIKASYTIKKFLQRENKELSDEEENQQRISLPKEMRQKRSSTSPLSVNSKSLLLNIRPTLIPVSTSGVSVPTNNTVTTRQSSPVVTSPERYSGPHLASSFNVNMSHSTTTTTTPLSPIDAEKKGKHRAYEKFKRWVNWQQQGTFLNFLSSLNVALTLVGRIPSGVR